MSINQKIRIAIAATMLLLFTISAPANAGTFIQQKGNTNPLTEGWEKYTASGVYPTSSSITNDLGTGIDAWSVNDSTSNVGALGGYAQYITTCQVNEAKTNGWRLKAKVRVVDPNSSFSNGVFYRDGQKTYQIQFSSTPNGDPTATLVTSADGKGINYTLTGGANAYHLYELVMPPNGTTAKLLIDGVERISSYSGLNLIVDKPLIFLGATSSYATGNVNYNLVQFVHP